VMVDKANGVSTSVSVLQKEWCKLQEELGAGDASGCELLLEECVCVCN